MRADGRWTSCCLGQEVTKELPLGRAISVET